MTLLRWLLFFLWLWFYPEPEQGENWAILPLLAAIPAALAAAGGTVGAAAAPVIGAVGSGLGAIGSGLGAVGSALGGATSGLSSAVASGLGGLFPGAAASAETTSTLGALGSIPELGLAEGTVLTQTPNALGGLGATGQILPGATSAVPLSGEASSLAAPLGAGAFPGTSTQAIGQAADLIGKGARISNAARQATKPPPKRTNTTVEGKPPNRRTGKSIPLTNPSDQQVLLRALLFGNTNDGAFSSRGGF